MFEPSWEKLLIVLVIALVVLGPRKLPEVGRSLGHGIREFKDGVSGKTPEFPPLAGSEEHTPQA
jgi:TatA/E family protein of Tat protein translocase